MTAVDCDEENQRFRSAYRTATRQAFHTGEDDSPVHVCRQVEYYVDPEEPEASSGLKLLQGLWGIVTLPLWGWVVALYFDWFIAPIFNLAPITLWQGAGLGLFAAVIHHKLGTRHISTPEIYSRIIEDTITPPFLAAIGWLIAKLVGVA